MSKASDSFEKLYRIVERLRQPDGCPWDREQTPLTMRPNIIEEAYECVQAISDGDAAHTREELGDLFLLATMTAYMHEQDGTFSVSDSLEDISAKLVRRHPHVFGNSDASTPDEVIKQWNDIKATVEGRGAKDSVLDEVSRSLPPLERAFKMQKKAAKVGFDWQQAGQVWDKLDEELHEARAECTALAANTAEGAASRLEEELGDLLFSVVNISRFLGVDPAVALQRANHKFEARFKQVEARMKAEGFAMGPDQFDRMDDYWNQVKTAEKNHTGAPT